MKKALFFGLIIGLCFAVNANIRPGNTGGKVVNGYDFYCLEVNDTVAPTVDMYCYLDGIAGYSQINFYVTGVSSGTAITTLNAIPLYRDGTQVTASQLVTSGTDLTEMRSPYYKLVIPAITTTRNVSFNILLTK